MSGKQHSTALLPPRTGSEPNVPRRFCLSMNRRGTYRVLYRIREDLHEVIILRVEHRRDVYHPL